FFRSEAKCPCRRGFPAWHGQVHWPAACRTHTRRRGDRGFLEQTRMTDSKTYLVTGGAGFLGINLVRYLLARGHRVTSLDIAEFDYPERSHAQVTTIKGDIRDRAAVDRAMQGVDIVVHCAAALPLYSREDIFSTDVDG